MSDVPISLPWLAEPLAQGLVSRAHALLLHGPGSVGQFELGLALATGWLCEAGEGVVRPCGQCPSCRLMASHMHPDFHLLLPDALREPLGWGVAEEGGEGSNEKKSKSKPSKEIRVDAMRGAIEWGQKTSSRGRGKVILVHPAQAMNSVAANALLKTLEEPGGSLRLVLTAHDIDALLPTVRSRCQRLPLSLPAVPLALQWLRAAGVSGPEVMLAAAGGQPLEASAMAADGIDSEAWERLPATVRRGHAAAVADWPLARLVDALQKLCHDLMRLRAGGEAQYFPAAALDALVTTVPPWEALAQWSNELTLAARHDEHAWHAGLRAEALVGQGAGLWHTARTRPPLAQGALDTLDAR